MLQTQLTQQASGDNPTDDVLDEALGLPLYSGRVRAGSFGVTPTVFFGKRPTDRRKPKEKPMTEREEQMWSLIKSLQEQVAQIQPQQSGQQSHAPPLAESPSIECNMPMVDIPEVFNVYPLYKCLMLLLRFRFITKIEHSFVG